MSAKYAQNVVIIGAGGQLGKVAVNALLKTKKHHVTAITRPESKSKVPEDVKIIKLDYTSEDSYAALVDTLRDHQAFIITLPVGTDRAVMHRLIRAADEARIDFVFPNYWGPDSKNDSLITDSFLAPLRDDLIDAFQNAKTSRYIFLACGMWFEFSLAGGLDRYGFDFQNRRYIRFDNQDVLMSVSTWPQCGRAIAGLLSLKLKPDSPEDKSPTLIQYADGPVYVASFHTSQRQMFEAVKRVTKTSDADWKITDESVKQRYQDGVRDVQAGDFSAFQKLLYSRQFFESADAWHEKRLANDVLGLPVEDFDEAVAEGVRMGEAGEIADAKHTTL